MSEGLETLAAALEARFSDMKPVLVYGELTCEVASSELLASAAALRDEAEFAFEQLIDLCAVDYLGYGEDEWRTQSATSTGFTRGQERYPLARNPGAPRRFAVVIHLLSLRHNRRLRLKVYCPDDDYPVVASVVGIWPAANWFEREAFDLYGILFEGHPDLRRILTDYGFIGHPFRKDFPLSGEVEMRYDPTERRIVYEPVTIAPRVLEPKVIRHANTYDHVLTGERAGDE
jgi:NADH-quinone oxidoreductase subunit C